MPISFMQQPIFGEAEAEFVLGPLESRHQLHESITGSGDRATLSGTRSRVIEQRGALLADSQEALQAMIAVIEAQVGAGPGPLDTGQGHVYTAVFIESFRVEPSVALGPRWRSAYHVIYRELQP